MNKKRETFGSKLGAILAAAGSAVGLGNIWRFPIETGQNGGAAFIIIYIASIVLLGLPLMISEFLIGRSTHSNAVGAFRTLSQGGAWRWVGHLGIYTGWLILSYYSVVGGWTIHYTFLSATSAFRGAQAEELAGIFEHFVANPWLPALWLILFIGATYYVVIRGVQSGIEKFSKLLMPLLFIIVVILMVCSLLLDGAKEGVAFLLMPDWSKVTSATVLNAMGQAFFSLSLGMGCLCTYASYFDESTRIGRTAVNVAFIDTFVAIMAGFIIFPSLFNIGLNPNEVAAGPSLIFISLPNVFNKAFGAIPVLEWIFSVLFYLMLFIAALTSSISLCEVITAYVSEEFKISRVKSATLVMVVCILLGALCSLSFGVLGDFKIFGFTIFDAFDALTGNILLPLGGMLISIFVGWVLDKKIVQQELSNNGTLRAPYFKILIFVLRYIAPLAIGVVFLDQIGLFSFIK